MDFGSIKLNDAPLQSSGDVTFEDVSQSDIAIIGISLKLPLADTVWQFADNLRAGLDCVRPIPSSRRNDMDRYFRWIGKAENEIPYGEAAFLDEVDKFDYRFFKLSPKEASLLDPNQRLFLQTAWSAIEDAGYSGEKLKESRTGVYIGYGSDSEYKKMIQDVEPDNMSLAMTGNVRSIIASRLSYLLDLRGPSLLVDTTCSSSLVAVHLACQAIRNGECDMVIAGGIQLHLVPLREAEVGIESTTSRARTFDNSSDGTGTGEGVVAIVLKSLEKAKEDRDSIYAVIKSSAMNQDGSSVGITAPNVQAQEAVIVEAWKKADVDPATIAYIETHGTGTKLGDPIEIEAIQRAFRRYTDNRQFCAVASLKSNVGHLDNTAGIAGLVKAALALQEKRIYPSLHFERPNREIDFAQSPVYVNDRLIDWERKDAPRRCGVSSFGMSGTNCHIVLEEAPEDGNSSSAIAESRQPSLLVWSAQTETALNGLARSCLDYFDRNRKLDLQDVGYTLSVGRTHYKYRLAILAFSMEEAAELLREAGLNGGSGRDGSTSRLLSTAAAKAEDVAEREGNRTDGYVEQLLQRHRSEAGKPDESLLRELGAAYVGGGFIPWESLYAGKKRRRVHLPAYAFDRERCWLEIPEAGPRRNAADPGKRQLFHRRVWVEQPIKAVHAADIPQTLLVFKDEGLTGEEIVDLGRAGGCRVIEVGIGESYRKISGESFLIHDDYADYARLFQDLKEERVDRILYLRSLGDRTEAESLAELDNQLNRSVYGLFFLAKALANETLAAPVEVIAATLLADAVYRSEEGRVLPHSQAMIGLGKTVGWENRQVRLRCMDLDEVADAAKTIWNESAFGRNDSYVTAYRNGIRYTDRIVPLEPGELPASDIKLSEDGIYLITGGMGGIGLRIASQLAAEGTVRLGLIGRSILPPRETWDAIIRKRADAKLAACLQTIRDIELTGSQVIPIQADVADYGQLDAAIDSMRRQYGRIAGVVHAAGISEGNLLGKLTLDEFKHITASKIQGTWLLDRLTRQDAPDFFVLFSSAITLVGGVGSGPYTAGNAYLDAYAAYRSRFGRTLVLNWPTWDGIGMAAGSDTEEDKEMFRPLAPHEGVKAFGQLLARDCRGIYIGEWNEQSGMFALGDLLPFRRSAAAGSVVRNVQPEASRNRRQAASGVPIRLKGKREGEYSQIEQHVAGAWKQVLGYDELDVHANFFEIGGDSILITKIHALIEANYPNRTTVADMFSYPTIARISEYLGGLTASEEQRVTDPSGGELEFDREVMHMFERIGRGELSIDDAVSMYHTLEVANG
ncbi:SDR family NAD(P)-dependent oxidoreductase [Paenibacillus sp. 1011MAR3C5]|uniref:type I polyketide synthase n=1 Tax=Paenibacillus sp. 1011MAR3C5 TaxID=1675787 RepID=UPI000E6CAC29|nr:type I polyketide synthase [Paenibacillus sp. 1011MAR3C5]RJE89655.1 SDR family NAD(P)-dependent oxidoreductase [Paenibacillus sp. 1011MAR3C5]